MKNFIFKTTLISLLLIVILTTFLSFGKMFYLGREYPMWKSKIEYALNNENNKNVIIGDSRALAGFRPKEINDNFINLAVGGGTAIESYYLLKKFLRKNTPEKIIISISPIHLESNKVFFERTLKFEILSKEEIQEVLGISKNLNEKFFLYEPNKKRQYKSALDFYKIQLKSNLISYNFFSFYRNNLKAYISNPFRRPILNYSIYKEIKTRDGNYQFGLAESSSGLNVEVEREKFVPSMVLDYYLKKILEIGLEKKIRVYVINTPFNEASYKKVDSNYINAYNNYFKNIKNKYINVVWLNEIFFYKNDCFGDPSHLNENGSEKFSKYVKNIVINKK